MSRNEQCKRVLSTLVVAVSLVGQAACASEEDPGPTGIMLGPSTAAPSPAMGTEPGPAAPVMAPAPTNAMPMPGPDPEPNVEPPSPTVMPAPTPTQMPTPDMEMPEPTPDGPGSDMEMPEPTGMGDPASCKWVRGDDPTEASILGTTKGPYGVETYSQGFNPGAGVTSHTVHVPQGAEPPFASIAIVPGFVSPESSIQEWGPFLASHGIVAVTIGVPGGDQPITRSQKLLTTLEGLKMEQARSGSPLEGKLQLDCMALMGWSMGGGGTLMSISSHPELKAGVGLCAWGPTGGPTNKVPVLMFEGTADVLAANMSDGFYAQTPATTPKMLFEVTGADHFYANRPSNFDGTIGAYGLSWLKLFLEGDERYRQFLTRPFPPITTPKSDHNLN